MGLLFFLQGSYHVLPIFRASRIPFLQGAILDGLLVKCAGPEHSHPPVLSKQSHPG
jgi:hypothetical protein